VDYDHADRRDAYRNGARDAYESAALALRAGEKRALEAWLVELEAWDSGDPPEPPHAWR